MARRRTRPQPVGPHQRPSLAVAPPTDVEIIMRRTKPDSGVDERLGTKGRQNRGVTRVTQTDATTGKSGDRGTCGSPRNLPASTTSKGPRHVSTDIEKMRTFCQFSSNSVNFEIKPKGTRSSSDSNHKNRTPPDMYLDPPGTDRYAVWTCSM